MSDTMDPMAAEVDQQELARQLLSQAKEQGLELVGPGGLLNTLTKNVLETARKRNWTSIWGMESTRWPGVGAVIHARAPARRPY